LPVCHGRFDGVQLDVLCVLDGIDNDDDDDDDDDDEV
jgi:hypothetical protein